MDVIEKLVDEFEQKELVQIAEHIGLSPVARWRPRKLARTIYKEVKDNVPEAPDEKDEKAIDILVEDFLFVAGLIDDEGSDDDIVETAEGGDAGDPDTVTGFMKMHNISDKPHCYSKADDQDPACKRCVLYRFCASERLALLPPCFGIMYDSNDQECKACLEAPFCKTKQENN